MTSKTKIDPRDHISLFKIIELRNGTKLIYQFALNIVKTKIGPRQRGKPDNLSFVNGNLMWTTVEKFQGTDYLVPHHIRMCSSRQSYNKTTGQC